MAKLSTASSQPEVAETKVAMVNDYARENEHPLLLYAGKGLIRHKIGEVPMLNPNWNSRLNMAFARAREHRHEFMTVEHLLLALLSNPSAREAWKPAPWISVALRQEPELHRTNHTGAASQ